MIHTAIVNCAQGDEVMLQPDMLDALVASIEDGRDIYCTTLGMEIQEEIISRYPNTIKIGYDSRVEILYLLHAAIPYEQTYPPKAQIPRRN